MLSLKNARNKRGEVGLSFPLVLILLLLSALILLPFLTFMGTGLAASRVYGGKTNESYAADSGIEDALWQIKYGHLNALFTSPHYDFCDYDTEWTYTLSEPVNGRDVNVAIRNIWVSKDIAVPEKSVARSIVAAGKLMVTGGVSGAGQYKITVSYYPVIGEDLRVNSIGIWLPSGFTYTNGTSTLEASASAPYYAVPDVSAHSGGRAVVWTFSSLPFGDLPDADLMGSPVTSEITFNFTQAIADRDLQAISWLTTSGVAEIPWAWDADHKVYKISATAGTTIIDTYTVKTELRQLTGAISGDYRAAGNSLLIDVNNDYQGIRETALSESTSTINDIPSDAQAIAGYLYWTAWRNDFSPAFLSSGAADPCQNFNNWNVVTSGAGSAWSVYSTSSFRGHYATGKDRNLTLKTPLGLTANATQIATVMWKQWRTGTLSSGDALQFRLSGDGGTSWSGLFTAFRYGDPVPSSSPSDANYTFVIPRQYLTANFKIRFYVAGFSGSGKYANIDNIKIVKMTADSTVKFKIDGGQVYLDGNGIPQTGVQDITADKIQVLPNFSYDDELHGYSYACFKDVTELIQTYTEKAADPSVNRPGNGNFTIGGVTAIPNDNWSYAAWSLIVIYSSPDTEGHQLFLYDKFLYASHYSDIDFDEDGLPGGTISGFIIPEPVAGEVNAARLTAFVGEGDDVWDGDSIMLNGVCLSNSASPWNDVWNSRSPGVVNDGIDIDTFDITWASGILNTGDTTATLNIPSADVDIWNLVYIILSFRSETKTGGTLSYQIH